jgi:hypothetical protein
MIAGERRRRRKNHTNTSNIHSDGSFNAVSGIDCLSSCVTSLVRNISRISSEKVGASFERRDLEGLCAELKQKIEVISSFLLRFAAIFY